MASPAAALLAILALGGAVALGACPSSDPPPFQPPPPPPPGPKLWLEAERVELATPDERWQVFEGDAARAVHAGAVAALRLGDGCIGWVETLPSEGRGREAIADAARARADLADGTLVSNEAFLFGPERTAWRYELWSTTAHGGKRAERAVVITYGERAWILHAYGHASVHGIVRSCLDHAIASMDVVPELP